MLGNFIPFVQNHLTYTDVNAKTISHNIANQNTPDYKAQSVAFDKMLNGQMKTELNTLNERHIPGMGSTSKMGYSIVTENTHNARIDGNNVDMTEEMVKLLKNNYAHSLGVSALNSEFNMYRSAIGR